MSPRNKKIFLILSLIWCVFWLFSIPYLAQAGQTQATQIEIHNGYFIGLKVEVKCDWEWQKGKYKFHQYLLIRKRNQTILTVPYGMKRCELYPKIQW